MTHTRRAAALMGAAALALGLAACGEDPQDGGIQTVPIPSGSAPSEPDTAATTGPAATAEPADPSQEADGTGTVDVYEIPTPSCFDMVDFGAVQEVALLDCAAPHDSEAYASFVFPDSDYPGDETISATGDQFCYDEFAIYVGTTWEESEFNFFYLGPNQETWEDRHDREILCIVQAPAPVEGTIAGSGR